MEIDAGYLWEGAGVCARACGSNRGTISGTKTRATCLMVTGESLVGFSSGGEVPRLQVKVGLCVFSS